MKKVLNLIVSIILLAGFSACNKDGSDNPTPVPTIDYKGLAFISSGESTVKLVKEGAPYEITLEYSTDESQWKPYTIGEEIALADGAFVLFRASEQNNPKFSKFIGDYYHFEMSGSITAQGNIMSLLSRDFSSPLSSHVFYSLFKGCASLLSAPELPATTLDHECYFLMFKECTGLKSAPELPAKVLKSGCYHGMFSGCTSLQAAPELPATELADLCYMTMFSGCTGLTSAPELPATELANDCYYAMFEGCTSLTSAPKLPAKELSSYCYFNMFGGCTSLTSAPELPATILVSRCYIRMFEGCTSLTSAPVLPAKDLVENCYHGMFRNCSKLQYVKALFITKPSKETTEDWLSGVDDFGTFVKSKDATWKVSGANGIPETWKIETE